jgi:YesN/AraC family two-component response regulator
MPVTSIKSFKAQTGECITDYIQKQKIEVAKTMLSDPTHSIAVVWTELGYYDQVTSVVYSRS